ncbi:MAG TPA: IS1182 family transposase [Chthonomonadaceae bacterium]|nr:IS1182 family transposase [Chthonomonadaceae bacterium]
MSTHFRAYCPDQPFLLPVSPQDWLPKDHVAYLVRDLVEELDLGAFYRAYPSDTRGAPAFDPKMMVGLLLYAWASDVYSTRQIAALCEGDLGGRYLAAGSQPDFRTINTFRLRHGDALADLFGQSVKLCQKAGMVSLGHVAIDGTKIDANASKRKAMSYARMVETEAKLRAEIEAYLAKSREVDQEEDDLFGKDARGPNIPEELRHRETRLAKIREARAALEAEQKAAQEAKDAERKARQEQTRGELRGRKPKQEDAPKPTAQRNFTDPDSRIMKAGNGNFIQGYNAQAAVDGGHQIIVACDLTNQAADAPHFVPMLTQVEQNTGQQPEQVAADAGYFSNENATASVCPNTELFIPPDRTRHRNHTGKVPVPDEIPTDALPISDQMRRKLSTESGREAYSWRMKTVEPTFGQVKGCAGSPGFRQIMRRGLTKAKEEWHWICATHNLVKYLRYTCGSAVAQ